MRCETLTWAGRWSTPPKMVAEQFDSPHTLAVVFAARDLPDEVTEELAAALPSAAVIGCSTAGQVADDMVTEAAAVAALIRFATVRPVAAAISLDAAESSEQAGARLARALRTADADVQAVFVLSDGLHVNGSELVAGMVAELPPGTGISGGLAGDGPDFAHTWTLHGQRRAERQVVAVALSGCEVTHGSAGGWEGFGPRRTITRSSGNVLAELDGRPALELYREYLGELSAGLPGSALMFPLSIEQQGVAEAKVRTVLAIDENDQTMTFAGDVPEGATARLMRTTNDRLVQGAFEAAEQSAQDSTESVSIAVSCVGRRLVLGQRTDEELEAVADALGGGTLVGFYSYGEITSAGGSCGLQNQTMTITTISEPSRVGAE